LFENPVLTWFEMGVYIALFKYCIVEGIMYYYCSWYYARYPPYIALYGVKPPDINVSGPLCGTD
jgi:hypothetical protein